MRHGLVLPNWEAGVEVSRLVEAAVVAEEAGWDGVFLADHLVFPPPSEIEAASIVDERWPMPDPWVTLAGIATRTSKIRLGTWITPVARRQPWQMARDLATLDRMSNGRVILGVGLGRRPDYEQFGQPWDFKTIASKTDEALALIERLWTGDRVTHKGDHYQLSDVALLPTVAGRHSRGPDGGLLAEGARIAERVPASSACPGPTLGQPQPICSDNEHADGCGRSARLRSLRGSR